MITVKHEREIGYIKVIVSGLVKSIDDSSIFKDAVEGIINLHSGMPLHIHFEDSFIITSSVIGTILKMLKKDEVDISVTVYKSELFDLLNTLKLVELLKVRLA